MALMLLVLLGLMVRVLGGDKLSKRMLIALLKITGCAEQ